MPDADESRSDAWRGETAEKQPGHSRKATEGEPTSYRTRTKTTSGPRDVEGPGARVVRGPEWSADGQTAEGGCGRPPGRSSSRPVGERRAAVVEPPSWAAVPGIR